MTLLPGARDFTLVDGDPVPPNLLNNLQDMFVGDQRGVFYPNILPSQFVESSPGFVTPANPNGIGIGAFVPVWKITAGTAHALFYIPTQGGDVVSDMWVDLYGDGTIDLTITPQVYSGMPSGSPTVLATVTINNVPAAWTRYHLGSLAAFTQATIPSGGTLVIDFQQLSVTQFYFSKVIPKLFRASAGASP